MAQFRVNAQRLDPCKNFTFRVKWDGRHVAGVSKVSALKRSTETVEHREGTDPSTSRKSSGRGNNEAITLQIGPLCGMNPKRPQNHTVWGVIEGDLPAHTERVDRMLAASD